MFRDRKDAGVKLGVELSRLQLHQPIVLALPRGGVPVAVEVAKAPPHTGQIASAGGL